MSIEEKTRSIMAEYGYKMNIDRRVITPSGKFTSLELVFKNDKIYGINAMNGTPIFSGTDIGEFLEKFWDAKKVSK